MWKIKDGGYPYIDGVTSASAFALSNPPPVYAWNIIDGGYPFLTTHKTAAKREFSEPYPTWMWKIVVDDDASQVQSEDYPVLRYERPIIVTPVRQYPYICVYDMITAQDGFETNGLRILSPTSCRVVEELNGAYEVTLEHPIDSENAWHHITELNILKVLGQLYTIYRVVSNFSGSTGKVTAYAKHISYQLADGWIYEATIEAEDGQHAVEQILAAMETHNGPERTEYTFTGTSDIEIPYKAEFSECTPIAALIGTDSTSVINQLGGELYRDNFRFSINQTMEGVQENAFYIRVGYNLTGIERDIDYSDFCTYFRAYDNFGNRWAVSYTPTAKFAHNVVRSKTFKYDKPDKEQLAKDGMAAFKEFSEPKITYKITIKDLRNNPDYAQFENISRYKVGDWGWIYDERLGIATKQKIIKIVRDGITGEVLELTFGNFERSLTRPVNRQNLIATASDKFLMKQELIAEAKAIRTWDDLSAYTWDEAHKFTWDQVEKG